MIFYSTGPTVPGGGTGSCCGYTLMSCEVTLCFDLPTASAVSFRPRNHIGLSASIQPIYYSIVVSKHRTGLGLTVTSSLLGHGQDLLSRYALHYCHFSLTLVCCKGTWCTCGAGGSQQVYSMSKTLRSRGTLLHVNYGESLKQHLLLNITFTNNEKEKLPKISD